MTRSPELLPPLPALTREAINSLGTWTWLEATAIGRIAFVLAAHPEGGTRAEVFAAGLGLADPADRMPYVGERVALSGPRARLRLDHCRYPVGLTVSARWTEFAAQGGPIALLVGLDPLPRYASAETVESYLGRARLRMGTTRIAGPAHGHRQPREAGGRPEPAGR